MIAVQKAAWDADAQLGLMSSRTGEVDGAPTGAPDRGPPAFPLDDVDEFAATDEDSDEYRDGLAAWWATPSREGGASQVDGARWRKLKALGPLAQEHEYVETAPPDVVNEFQADWDRGADPHGWHALESAPVQRTNHPQLRKGTCSTCHRKWLECLCSVGARFPRGVGVS